MLELLASKWTLLAIIVGYVVIDFLLALNAPVTLSRPYVEGVPASARVLALAASAAIAAWVGARLVYDAQLRRRFGDHEIRVSEPRGIPLGLLPIEGQLEELGFWGIGEIEVRLPWKPWTHSWVYAASEPITAALGCSRVSLTTTWPDGSYVLTAITNERAAQRRTPDAWQLVSRGNLTKGLARHRASVARFGAGRGAPLTIRSAADAVEATRRTLPNTAAMLEAEQRAPTSLALIAFAMLLAVAGTLFAIKS